MSYFSEVMADAPLAYYRMDDSGPLQDSSGNGRAGAYWGTFTLGQAPLIGAGQSVNFTGGYATVANNPWLDFTTFTVEAWINPASTAGDHAVITHSDWQVAPSSPGRAWHVLMSNGRINFGLNFTDGSYHDAVQGSTLAAGTTHHVVGTWDGTTAAVYLDGALDWSSTAYAGKTLRTTNVQQLSLAAGQASAGAVATYSGRLDEVALYGSALSAARVAAHAAAGNVLSGVWGWVG